MRGLIIKPRAHVQKGIGNSVCQLHPRNCLYSWPNTEHCRAPSLQQKRLCACVQQHGPPRSESLNEERRWIPLVINSQNDFSQVFNLHNIFIWKSERSIWNGKCLQMAFKSPNEEMLLFRWLLLRLNCKVKESQVTDILRTSKTRSSYMAWSFQSSGIIS